MLYVIAICNNIPLVNVMCWMKYMPCCCGDTSDREEEVKDFT